MKIGIVGGGTVGRATARCFMEHAEVRVYDVVRERATHTLGEVLDSDLTFICLPTPQKKDSLECDTSIIEDFCNMLGGSTPDGNFVIRSTVPIGETRRLAKEYDLTNLLHSPEFLTARCANTDAQMPARNIVGSPCKPQNIWDDSQSAVRANLIDLYRSRFPGVPVHVMTSDESEAVKLFLNGFFAVKVSYFNEVRCLADKLGMDWERVIQGVLSDGRIAYSHTRVPGPDGKFGFGGECLPKDLGNLIACMEDARLDMESWEGHWVTKAALERNKRDRERTA